MENSVKANLAFNKMNQASGGPSFLKSLNASSNSSATERSSSPQFLKSFSNQNFLANSQPSSLAYSFDPSAMIAKDQGQFALKFASKTNSDYKSGLGINADNNYAESRVTDARNAAEKLVTASSQSQFPLDEIKLGGDINNPYVNKDFSDFKNFGREELENYYGDLDAVRSQYGQMGGDGVPEAIMHEMKEDSQYASFMRDNGMADKDLKNLWDNTSEIAGALFQKGTDKFENAMADKVRDFQEAGALGLLTNFGDTIADQGEVLAHAMMRNISAEGIESFKPVYAAYLKNRDNVANAGMVTRDSYNHYKATGDLKPGVDHGHMQLSDTEMKELVHELNHKTFTDVVNAMGYDAAEVEDHLQQNLGIRAMNNHDGTVFAALGLTSMMTEKGPDGRSGLHEMVDKSRARDGDMNKRYASQATISIMNDSVSRNTDGTAFSRAEGAVFGLDSVSSIHGKGVSDGLVLNQFVFGNQGAADVHTANKLNQQLTTAREAGVDFDRLDFHVSGHGSAQGGVLLSSEKSSGDSGMFDMKDVPRYAKVLANNISNGGTITITNDACECAPTANALRKAVKTELEAQGKVARIDSQGSRQFGLVSTHQLGRTTNGAERYQRNDDGSISSHRLRGDHNNGDTNIDKQTSYAGGKEAFLKLAGEKAAAREARMDLVDEQGSGDSVIKASDESWGDAGSSPAPKGLVSNDNDSAVSKEENLNKEDKKEQVMLV